MRILPCVLVGLIMGCSHVVDEELQQQPTDMDGAPHCCAILRLCEEDPGCNPNMPMQDRPLTVDGGVTAFEIQCEVHPECDLEDLGDMPTATPVVEVAKRGDDSRCAHALENLHLDVFTVESTWVRRDGVPARGEFEREVTYEFTEEDALRECCTDRCE